MINNRQGGGGRRRGRGGGGANGPRQGGQQGNGSRIDNRARGNATQLYEKYKNMASDAQRAGDRVNTEYYFQFADHYFRVLSEQRGRFEDQQPRRPRDEFDGDGDDEYGDEGEPVRAREGWGEQQGQGEAPRMERDDARRDEGRREEVRRDEGRRDGPGREPRADGRREWRDRPERQDRPERAEQNGRPQRNGAVRSDVRPDQREDTRPVEPELIAGQRRAEPLAPGESVEARAAEVIDADRPLDPPAPRRRGRPRRDQAPETGAIEAAPAAFEADRLPPALTVPANDAAPAGDEPKPRRRRVRSAGEDVPSAAE